MKPCTILAGALAASLAGVASAATPAPLKIISVDVEGGAATLYVTPGRHALLIDTGFPAGMGGPRPAPGAPPPPPSPSSAERIVTAAKAAGVTKLDYVLITHYHGDHIGGVFDLMALIPIDTFLDHGPNRESPAPNATPAQIANSTQVSYARYSAAMAGRKHRILKAGATLTLDGLKLTVVNSDGEPIAKPVPGGGGPGVDCAAATTKAEDGGQENVRSVGLLASWGKARILSLGDTTWNLENRLVCPTNLIGPVDLMMSTHHGADYSNSPNALNTIRPRVLVMNNGATKGGDPAVLDRVAAMPGLQGWWQLHSATRSPEKNGPVDQIANVEATDAMYPLNIAVEQSGQVSITNPRNGFTRTYPPGR